MKARITTVLSLTGVLVAGSAAALVNTQVLQNSTTKSSSVAVVLKDEPESVSTVSTAPAVESLPNKLEDVVGVAVTLATTPVSTQQEYAIGESGTVVLDTANGALTIVGVTPSAGWMVVEQKNTEPLIVEIKFQSATTLVEFTANALMGVVAWDTESSLLPQPTTGDTTDNTTGKTVKPTVVTTASTHTTTGATETSPGTTQNTTGTSVDDHGGDDSSHHGGGGGDDD
jgi:hypothetical protein